EAGRSPTRILAPVLGFSVLLTGGLVLLQETVAPRAVEARLRVERVMEGQEERTTSKVPHVRDNAGNTWSFGRYDHHDRKATRVRVVPFRTDGREYDLLEIPSMQWRTDRTPSGWYADDAHLLLPASEGGGVALVAVPADRPLPTSLLPEDVDIARASEDLQGLSSERLSQMRARNPGLHFLTVLQHRRWTYPLANLVLLLVGVPLVLRSRGSSVFLSVLAALGVCAAYFTFDTVACDLGGRGLIPPVVATWLGTVVFGAAGVTLLDGAGGSV
ncbi:MAG: LptF/LptG family permease, partial [Planctomycetota bacterium]